MARCLRCGEQFERTRPNRKYCSEECRKLEEKKRYRRRTKLKTQDAESRGSRRPAFPHEMKEHDPRRSRPRRRARSGPRRVMSISEYRRSMRATIENAVSSLIEERPGADADFVSVRLGLPVGRARSVLEEMALRGELRVESEQHGRCYFPPGEE